MIAISHFSHYNATIECMDKLIRNCLQSGGDVTQANSIRDRMYTDLVYICGNNDTFIKFQKYSECFGEVAKESARCQDRTLTATPYEYRYSEDGGYEYSDRDEYSEDETICEAVNQLLTCINAIVSKRCDAEAVELYDHMVLSQLPSHITEACPRLTANGCSASLATPLACIPLLVTALLESLESN
ncbi:hypothetical protein LSH36_734g02083 [Paralvinella palmiformis]|uniref:Uncharacterized protein n=1 Tax=Paralvinella palmiformis TaxID=53620 RepID=A0AAD9J273_9ANNE|nr:hypothetical protein LSH36_734g02083 [Paralvinella palmiformis]